MRNNVTDAAPPQLTSFGKMMHNVRAGFNHGDKVEITLKDYLNSIVPFTLAAIPTGIVATAGGALAIAGGVIAMVGGIPIRAIGFSETANNIQGAGAVALAIGTATVIAGPLLVVGGVIHPIATPIKAAWHKLLGENLDEVVMQPAEAGENRVAPDQTPQQDETRRILRSIEERREMQASIAASIRNRNNPINTPEQRPQRFNEINRSVSDDEDQDAPTSPAPQQNETQRQRLLQSIRERREIQASILASIRNINNPTNTPEQRLQLFDEVNRSVSNNFTGEERDAALRTMQLIRGIRGIGDRLEEIDVNIPNNPSIAGRASRTNQVLPTTQDHIPIAEAKVVKNNQVLPATTQTNIPTATAIPIREATVTTAQPLDRRIDGRNNNFRGS